MNFSLFAIIILFFFPIIYAFGEYEIDTDFMLYKGNQYFKLNDYEMANFYYDQVLDKEPNNVEALYNKGNTLSSLGKYNEAILYFEQDLIINPQNHNAQIGLHNSLVQIVSYKFGFLDGVLEIKVYDSQGGLVAFQRTKNILAFEHEITENLVETWPVSKVVTRNNQNFAIHQQEFVEVLDRDTIFGFHQIPYSENVNVPLASTWHIQIPVEKGDVVTYDYLIYRPVN